MRLEKGMSQQELGDMIGVTKVSVCGYENGTRTPSLETFCILADIFETTTDYLLGREVPVVSEDGNEYIGSISKDDIDIMYHAFEKDNVEINKTHYDSLLNGIKIYEDIDNRLVTIRFFTGKRTDYNTYHNSKNNSKYAYDNIPFFVVFLFRYVFVIISEGFSKCSLGMRINHGAYL